MEKTIILKSSWKDGRLMGKTKEGLVVFPDKKFTDACAGIVTNVTVTHEMPNYCFICGDMLVSDELSWSQIHDYAVSNKLVLGNVMHGAFGSCKFTILTEARERDFNDAYKVLGVVNDEVSELFSYAYMQGLGSALGGVDDISLYLTKIALEAAPVLSDIDLLAVYARNLFNQNKTYYKLGDNIVISVSSWGATVYCKCNGHIVDFTVSIDSLKEFHTKMIDISDVLGDLKSQTLIASADLFRHNSNNLSDYVAKENANIQGLYGENILIFKSVCSGQYHVACINSDMLINLADYDEDSQKDLLEFVSWFNQETDKMIASEVKKISGRNLAAIQRYNWRAQLARSY